MCTKPLAGLSRPAPVRGRSHHRGSQLFELCYSQQITFWECQTKNENSFEPNFSKQSCILQNRQLGEVWSSGQEHVFLRATREAFPHSCTIYTCKFGNCICRLTSQLCMCFASRICMANSWGNGGKSSSRRPVPWTALPPHAVPCSCPGPARPSHQKLTLGDAKRAERSKKTLLSVPKLMLDTAPRASSFCPGPNHSQPREHFQHNIFKSPNRQDAQF